jgi:hypothetical protein
VKLVGIEVDTKPEISGHHGGHQAAKLLRRKELVPKKGFSPGVFYTALVISKIPL